MNRKAAFFKVEGALVRPSHMPPATYYVLNQREMKARFARLGGLVASKGLSLLSPLGEFKRATKLAWSSLRGMSEDRLHVLSEEYAERQLIPALRTSGVQLVEAAQAQGYVIVLISEMLEEAIAPIAERLGADYVIANRMEIDGSEATGRLLDPVVAQLSGQWAKAFAEKEGIDLAASMAYGATGGDALLLSAVGEPCVIHPDWRLRQIAKEQAWPIVEAS